jgi:serine/threonine protein kinase
VALKILAQDNDRHELDVLKRIKTATQSTPEHIINLLDYFEIGDEETHLCLVLEVMWQDAFKFCSGFSADDRVLLAKQISGHVLQGLESLQRLGVIHNGKF